MDKRDIRCVIYLRVSLDATGEELAITRQRKDCLAIAAARGWTVVQEFVDNSISASGTKKRPDYDAMWAAYQRGEFQAIVCWNLDRLTRQPRQLEAWIDAAEKGGLLVATVQGEIDLTTANGRAIARILGSIARQEMETKGARQRRAALQRAEAGAMPKGTRLFGYTREGKLDPVEAPIVREMFSRFSAGDSVKGISIWLNETGAPTRFGRKWNNSTVRGMLLNPRYAGRAIYNGEANGVAGQWEALVDADVFDAVVARLSDPRRRKQYGTDRKYIGSGLYQCGVCDAPISSWSGRRYRCPAAHLTRMGDRIDAYVLATVRARLGRPDLADLLPIDDSDAREAAEEMKRLNARLLTVEADYDADLIDGRRYKAKRARLETELAAAGARAARGLDARGNLALLTSADPVSAFDAAPVGVKQAVIRCLATVHLDVAPRGYRFSSQGETVRITWSPAV